MESLATLTRSWWVIALRGVAALLAGIVAGILTSVWPPGTAVVLLWGALAVVSLIGIYGIAFVAFGIRLRGLNGWLNRGAGGGPPAGAAPAARVRDLFRGKVAPAVAAGQQAWLNGVPS